MRRTTCWPPRQVAEPTPWSLFLMLGLMSTETLGEEEGKKRFKKKMPTQASLQYRVGTCRRCSFSAAVDFHLIQSNYSKPPQKIRKSSPERQGTDRIKVLYHLPSIMFAVSLSESPVARRWRIEATRRPLLPLKVDDLFPTDWMS